MSYFGRLAGPDIRGSHDGASDALYEGPPEDHGQAGLAYHCWHEGSWQELKQRSNRVDRRLGVNGMNPGLTKYNYLDEASRRVYRMNALIGCRYRHCIKRHLAL